MWFVQIQMTHRYTDIFADGFETPTSACMGKISHRPAVIWRIYLLLCLSDVHFVVISSAQLPIHCGANIWFILFISADKYWVKPISPRSPQRLHDLHVTMTPPSRRKSLILHARCLTPFPRPIWEFCEVVPKCAAVGNPNDRGRGGRGKLWKMPW